MFNFVIVIYIYYRMNEICGVDICFLCVVLWLLSWVLCLYIAIGKSSIFSSVLLALLWYLTCYLMFRVVKVYRSLN